MLFGLFELVKAVSYSQILVFDQDKEKHFCNITLEPAVDISSYYIYKNSDKGANNAVPVHEGRVKRLQANSAGSSKYQCEIISGKNKVKLDGTAYAFKLPINGEKAQVYTEPFAWNNSTGTFDYCSQIPTPFYKTKAFYGVLAAVCVVLIGGAVAMMMKKKKENAEEEL